ncbi:MAG: ATP synthase F0 subunit B [Acidobacteria bacterium]|nr:ATP synthase F0 subunit B [Acidobacteriota bacterium]
MRRQSHLRWYVLSSVVALVVLWSGGWLGNAYWQSGPEQAEETAQHASESPASSQQIPHTAQETEAHQDEEEHGAATSTWDQVFQWINFLVVIGALAYLSKKYIAPLLDQRAKAIREEMEHSAQALEEASRRLTGIEEKLLELDTEIAGLRRSALQEAEAEKARIEQQSEQEAGKIALAAEQEIQAATKTARQELKAYTAELAIALAQKRIQDAISPEVDKRMVRSFVEELGQNAPSDDNGQAFKTGPAKSGNTENGGKQ